MYKLCQLSPWNEVDLSMFVIQIFTVNGPAWNIVHLESIHSTFSCSTFSYDTAQFQILFLEIHLKNKKLKKSIRSLCHNTQNCYGKPGD